MGKAFRNTCSFLNTSTFVIMAELARRSVSYLFRLACFLFAGYMILIQILKYSENLDTPKITFKELKESPEDKYPDITFCFAGVPNQKNMYKESWFTKNSQITAQKYHYMLNGESRGWTESLVDFNISGIDYNKATIGAVVKRKHFFPKEYSTTFVNGTQRWYPNLLQKSYQIPGKVCFTRTFKKLDNETFLLSFEKLGINLKDVSLSLFVHYPGQIMRTIFGRDRILKSVFKISQEDLEGKNESKVVEVNLSQMQVVKGRADGNKPCNPKPYMDDHNFWLNIYRRLECLPPYWKYNGKKKTEMFIQDWQLGSYNLKKLSDCKNESQFKKMHDLVSSEDQKNHMMVKHEIVSSFPPPCNEMAINVNIKQKVNKKDEKVETSKNTEEIIWMKIFYMMQTYQEIKNEKEFSFEMLWSSIGGFVGMFIGYSMLQLLDNGLEWITSFNQQNKSKDEENLIPLSEKLRRESRIKKTLKYVAESRTPSRFSVSSSPHPNY